MLRLTCFTLLVGIVLGLDLNVKLDGPWAKFKSVHGKQYSGDEETKRQEIFKKHVEDIVNHNLKNDLGVVDYTLGINQFSDLSHEDFVKNVLSIMPPRTHKKDFTVFKSTEGRSKRSPIPGRKDWRKAGVVSPVKDQGTKCGSCWAFSATGAIESAWAIANHTLVVLSDQQLLDCAKNNSYECYGCIGGWPDSAMQYVIDNNGQDTGACYPDLFTQNPTCNYQPSCSAVTISSVVDIQVGNENDIKEVVGTIGPVSVCMNASEHSFKHYKSGIYNPSSCSQNTDHAVLIVGYGRHENGKHYWLVKNSWATWWGENGYFKLFRNDNDLNNGTCGIATAASYPVV